MLKGKCFFPLVKMINKLQIKEELKELYVDVTGKSEDEKNAIVKEKGLDFTFIILSKIELAEREVKEFMSAYMEKPIDEVLEMDMFEIAETLKGLFLDSRFQTFFQQTMK
jgi:uncharacterized OsmC-like protein